MSAIKRAAIRKSAAALGGAPLSLLRRLAGSPLVAPLYHLVADKSPPHCRHLFPIRTPQQFEAEIDFLLQRFVPVNLQQLYDHACQGRPLPARAMHLSFDDGLREVKEVIAPILQRKDVAATLFINSAFVDNAALGYRHKASLLCDKWETLSEAQRGVLAPRLADALGNEQISVDGMRAAILSVHYADAPVLDVVAQMLEVDCADYLKKQRPYLDTQEIQRLTKQGFDIGAHSVDHPRYSEIPLEAQLAQTGQSLNFIAERFAVPCRAFAFPFVSDGVEPAFFDAVYGSGTVDLLFCIGSVSKADRRNVHRWPIEFQHAPTPAAALRDFYVQQIRAGRQRA